MSQVNPTITERHYNIVINKVAAGNVISLLALPMATKHGRKKKYQQSEVTEGCSTL